MGNGIIQQVPDFDNFRKLSEEYDKLKFAGLSVEEMHGILCHRIKQIQKKGSTSSGPVQPAISIVDIADGSGKESAVRAGEGTKPAVGTQPTAVATRAPVAPAPAPSSGLVLLIDDSAVAAKVASKVLLQLNFEVVIANSAKAGFDILLNRKDDINLIFLDVVMPTVDGVECLGWIKDNSDVSHIPVYMLSGLEDNMLTDVCLERGAEGMLLKPLNPDMVKKIMKCHSLGADNPPPPGRSESLSDVPSTGVANKPLIAQSLRLVIPSSEAKEESKQPQLQPTADSNTPTMQHTAAKKANVNTVGIGQQGPSFKLVDSDFNEYSFPNPNSRKNVLLLFIPTVFCTHFFEETGFLMRFFKFYEPLTKSNSLFVACISADLPFALSSAKKRFSLPFTLLSDPTLFVSQRYVGSIDIGRACCKLDNVKDADHPQNSFVGPMIGMVLLNKKRDVLNKWTARMSTFDSLRSLQQGQFPDRFEEWVSGATELGPSSPRRSSNISPRPRPEPKGSLGGSNSSMVDIDAIRVKAVAQASSSRAPVQSATIDTVGPAIVAGTPSAPVASAEAPAPVPSSSKTKPNILVVDDSSVSSRVCSKKLELLGFSVVTAYNGQQAFEQIKKKPAGFFSIILSDVVMPVCDGIGLLKLLKEEDAYRDIPVVMMSGLEGEELCKSCLDLGANCLMKKPFDDSKFLEAIEGLNILQR